MTKTQKIKIFTKGFFDAAGYTTLLLAAFGAALCFIIWMINLLGSWVLPILIILALGVIGGVNKVMENK